MAQCLSGVACLLPQNYCDHLLEGEVPNLPEYLTGQKVHDEFRDVPHQVEEKVADAALGNAKIVVGSCFPLFFGFAGNGKTSTMKALFRCLGDHQCRDSDGIEAATHESIDCTKDVGIYKCKKELMPGVMLLAADTRGWNFGEKIDDVVRTCKQKVFAQSVRDRSIVPQVFYAALTLVLVVNAAVAATRRQTTSPEGLAIVKGTCASFHREQLKHGVNAKISLVVVVTHADMLTEDKKAAQLLEVKGAISAVIPPFVDIQDPIAVCSEEGKSFNIDALKQKLIDIYHRQVSSPEVRLILFKTVKHDLFTFLQAQLARHRGILAEEAAARRCVWAMAQLHGFRTKKLDEVFPGMTFAKAHALCDAMLKHRQAVLESKKGSHCFAWVSQSQLQAHTDVDFHVDALRVDWNKKNPDWKPAQSCLGDRIGESSSSQVETKLGVAQGAQPIVSGIGESSSQVETKADPDAAKPIGPASGESSSQVQSQVVSVT